MGFLRSHSCFFDLHEAVGVGGDFLMQVLDETLSPHQVSTQLLDELRVPRLALSAGGILVCFRHRRTDCEEVAHVERHGLDQDDLVTFQLLELPRQAIQALRHGGLALIAGVGRQPGGERRGNDGRFGDPLHRREFVKPACMFAFEEIN
jgi:hypothetical protein